MGVRRNFSTGGNFDILPVLFQVADDAVQMDIHKTLYPFQITNIMPYVTSTVTKFPVVGSNASFSLMRLFTLYKLVDCW